MVNEIFSFIIIKVTLCPKYVTEWHSVQKGFLEISQSKGGKGDLQPLLILKFEFEEHCLEG